MSRKQRCKPGKRPFLEGFGQQRMIRVGQGALREVPGFVPAEVRIVEKDAHQLGDRHRRMRVVQLDGDFFGEQFPVAVGASESPHEVAQRAGDEEKFLDEPQSLPLRRRIVRVEHARDRFGRERFGQRADEVAVAELLEVEEIRGRGGPQSQRVDRLAAVADDRPIEGNADQARWPSQDRPQLPAVHLERAVEFDLDFFVRPRDLPGVGATQPIVGLLLLPAILDRLPEDAVLITQAVAHGGKLQGGHRVEEAGGETAQAAVAQAGVGLLFENFLQIDVPLSDRLPGEGFKQKVGDVVCQRTADQEFHREVVDAFWVLPIVGFVREDPALREDVPHRLRKGLEPVTGFGVGQAGNVVEYQVPLVKRVVGSGERDRSAAVLLQQLRDSIGTRRWRGRC